jgi:two-component system, NarL family, nitrate/nitrite response regulator NarL
VELMSDLASPVERLSPHESELLSHIVAGHSNKVIAQHFGVADVAVKALIEKLLAKIRMTNRTQATIWVLSNCPSLTPPLVVSPEWEASFDLVAAD